MTQTKKKTRKITASKAATKGDVLKYYVKLSSALFTLILVMGLIFGLLYKLVPSFKRYANSTTIIKEQHRGVYDVGLLCDNDEDNYRQMLDNDNLKNNPEAKKYFYLDLKYRVCLPLDFNLDTSTLSKEDQQYIDDYNQLIDRQLIRNGVDKDQL